MLKRIFINWRSKLLKRYRVEVIDDVTLSQSRMFLYRPLKLVLLVTISSILLIGSTSVLIFFVPFIRKQIPGYLNPAVKEQQAELMSKVQILGQQIEVRDSLIKTLQNSLMDGRQLPAMQIEELEDLEELDIPVTASTPAEETSTAVATAAASGENVEDKNRPDRSSTSSGVTDIPTTSDAPNVRYSSNYISPIHNLFSPVPNGRVSNIFSLGKSHYGIDLVAEENELVRSAADGFVIMAEYHEENGYVIGVASRDNLITFYKHNSTLYKKVGEYVLAGEAIAVMGNSGENSTGPHLHFEVWYKGTPIDPALYINFN